MAAFLSHAPRRIAALSCLAALGGCGAGGDYPSLAPRPVEQLSFGEPAPRPAEARPADTAIAARYAPLVERARHADADFQAVLAANRHALSAGRSATVGSEAWIAAQEALSRVETARGPVAAALADLDAAETDPANANDAAAAAAIAAAIAQIKAIDAQEREALAALSPPTG